MMRTLTLVLVCLLLVSCAFALESGPSNKVGYVKTFCYGYDDPPNVHQDVYTEFGLAFRFWDVPGSNVPTYGSLSMCPSDVVGSQPAPGAPDVSDQIIRQDGDYGFRGPDLAWYGFLESDCSMEPATAYWYRNSHGTSMDLVLAGDAEIDVNNIPPRYIAEPPTTDPADENYVPYSWRDARELDVATQVAPGLFAQGFLGGESADYSDMLVQQGLAGDYAWYRNINPGMGWYGGMTTVVPGEGYWISNKHVGNSWIYTFAPPTALGQVPSSKPTISTIAKFKHSLVKKAPVKARTTER